jgi:hypothetical protein
MAVQERLLKKTFKLYFGKKKSKNLRTFQIGEQWKQQATKQTMGKTYCW